MREKFRHSAALKKHGDDQYKFGANLDDDDDIDPNFTKAIEEQSWRSYYSDIDGAYKPTGCCHCQHGISRCC